MSKKISVKISDIKTFSEQDRARKYILDITNAGVLFFSVHDVKEKETLEEMQEEKSEPEANPAKKSVKKKAPVKQLKTGGQQKYPDEMEAFVRRKIEYLVNQELVDEINHRWKVDINKSRFAAYLQFKNIKRKPLKKLPPEDDDEDFHGPDYVDA